APVGKPLLPVYRYNQAKLWLCVSCDFMGTWLAGEEHTQQYMANRDYKSLKNGKMSRHMQFESGLSLTGTNADVRIAIKPSEEGAVLRCLQNQITGQSLAGDTTNGTARKALKIAALGRRNEPDSS